MTRTKTTVRRNQKTLTSSIGTSVAPLFPDGPMLVKGDVVHIANNHATQVIYVKWANTGTPTPTISSTDFYEQIPAGESRQFQMENPSVNPDQGIGFFLLGSGATTSYNAVVMRS